ncbi:MAG: alcohol dehydrogenase [Caulobacteraceae bacterium]|nr:alcohol dehydrogenase [Caulobacteraceae bacterium]
MNARGLLIGLAVVVAIGVAAGLWIISGPGPMAFAGGGKVALADYHSPSPAGAPASLANATLVQRGEYLARAADCLVCHTARGGRAYAGGYAFALPFGTLYSTNITPDRETGIGAYSDADFLAAVHRGVRRDGARLYPAMPFPSYTYMTDADALAIKAYLFSLPPVHAPNRPDRLAFPFDQRWLMAAWSRFFNADTRFHPYPSQSPEWNRGAYLAEALAHCGECHTPRNIAFALDNRRKFAGAVTAGWRAYDISSDKGTGVGGWSETELAAYLAAGHAAGRGTATGPMGEAVDQSFSTLAPEDLRALVAYVRSVPPKASPDLPATLAGPASGWPKQGPALADARGKRMFEGACASCHDWTGVSPLTPMATLTGSRAVNDPSAVNVAQVVISGARRWTPQGVVTMPAFGHAYSDAEIAAVANYVTARFGAKPSRISEAGVAALRRATAQ